MMFQLNPSARLRAVFVARRGDVVARRCAYRAGHDTPIITGDKLMNNKILSFLTALGLAAACLATSSAFAVGAYRVGGYAYVEGGVTVTVLEAGAVGRPEFQIYRNQVADREYTTDSAVNAAVADCDGGRQASNGDYLAGIINCVDIPSHDTNTEGVFTDQCVVIVVEPGVRGNTDPNFVFDPNNDYGVGLGANCEMAMMNALANCSNNCEVLPLNDSDHLYVIDGIATACGDGKYNAGGPVAGLDCKGVVTHAHCIGNNPRLPIQDGLGVCKAAEDNECFTNHGMGMRRLGDDPFPPPEDPEERLGDDRVADDGLGSCNRILTCNGAVEYSTREGLCGQCSGIDREAGSGARCGECVLEYEDTGEYINSDGMEVDADDVTAPAHTMCTQVACVALNRADRETEGDLCGECLPGHNDTNAVDDDRMCVPNETCMGNNDGIPDGTGGCTDPDTTCLAIEGRAETENRVEIGASCICADGFGEVDGVCVPLCEEGQIVNGDRCISFSYFINGNRVTDDLNSDPVEGTEEEPFDIALADVADFSTTVMTPISDSDGNAEDVVYSKAAESEDREQQINDLIEQQSIELIVDSEGVVTFDPETFDPDNTDTPVSPGTYNIVIAVNSDEDADIPLDEILLDVVYVTVQAAPVIIPPPPPSVDVSEPSPVSESGGADLKIVLGVIGVGAWALYAYYWNVVPQYSWTPSYAFRNDNGNISYSVGSRWTATADNLQFYWQTSQSSASSGDQLVYGSGIKYNNGVFSVAMNSEGDSDETDLDISLLANKQLGLWQLKGGYNFDMQTSPTETDTQSRFNVAAQYSLNKWVLSTTANTDGDTTSARFAARYTVDRWILSATTNTDGDTTSARINYSYRF